jgi:hypothetical protein
MIQVPMNKRMIPIVNPFLFNVFPPLMKNNQSLVI